jgi:hypothetical protein
MRDRLHVAFVTAPIMLQLRAGTKTVESRLSVKRPPSWDVRPGDRIVFKCGDLLGAYAAVDQVDRYEGPALDVRKLAARYGRDVGDPATLAAYWEGKLGARYAVFMHLADPCPIEISRAARLGVPSTRSAWLPDFRPSRSLGLLLDEALL